MNQTTPARRPDTKTPDIKMLFWNTNKKNLDDALCALASDLEVDIILLAEYPSCPASLLSSLRQRVDSSFFEPKRIGERFVCLSSDPSLSLNELASEPRFSLRRFIHDSHNSILVIIHGVDPVNHDIDHRNAEAQVEMMKIKGILKGLDTQRVVLIGDFNVNPFDRCMNLPMTYNAMMTRRCVARGTRTYQFESYDLFYNPMWSLFGDLNEGPPGTYYYTGTNGMRGWNMLDQVLLHHSLAGYLNSIRIVDSTPSLTLADARGHPNAIAYSDHFPILINLKRSLP
jgi:exonuclease III